MNISKSILQIILASVLLLAVVPFSVSASHHIDSRQLPAQQDEIVVLNLSSGSNISTLDPALATDSVSITPIQNLFLGLTDIDPFTSEVVPELATQWEVSGDGLTWTFHLRDDVMWIHYNPATQTSTQIRPVTADDFVFAIQRACDPRLESYYGGVIASTIAGCDVVNDTPVDEVTDDLVFGDTIQIEATDTTILTINLNFPAAYFLSMMTVPVMHAVPTETIEEHGDNWTLPDNIVTNGPYFVEEMTEGIRRVFVRNQQFPSDLWHGGNIDRIEYTYIEDGGTTFALYQDEYVDRSGIPGCELCSGNEYDHPEYSEQIHQIYDNAVFYFGFNIAKSPFDNVHLRRAFSAIIHRQAFVEQIQRERGVPMIHFTPPLTPHAPPIDDIGIVFDPDYARQQLALAGYPDCEGLPEINVFTYIGAGTWAEFWAEGAEEHLGCDPDLFNIEQIEFSKLLALIDPSTPLEDRPHAWTLGWGSDYPDPHNWLYQVLSCERDNPFGRECNAIDDLMTEAATELDPDRRTQLYAEIEEAFFGENGEFPIAPIYLRSAYILIKPWYTGPHTTDGIYGGLHWDAYSIDMEAKRAAQES